MSASPIRRGRVDPAKHARGIVAAERARVALAMVLCRSSARGVAAAIGNAAMHCIREIAYYRATGDIVAAYDVGADDRRASARIIADAGLSRLGLELAHDVGAIVVDRLGPPRLGDTDVSSAIEPHQIDSMREVLAPFVGSP